MMTMPLFGFRKQSDPVLVLDPKSDITDPRRILQATQRLLKECDIDRPPVRVDEITEIFGYRVLLNSWPEPFHGQVRGVINVEKHEITIEATLTNQDKIFSIAHLLGHIMLHQEKLNEVSSQVAILANESFERLDEDPYERAANFFAVNLLMPDEFVLRYRSLDLKEQAEIFGVAPELVLYRARLTLDATLYA